MIQHQLKKQVQGIALIAVLWIVAALSIIVTGVVHTVRSEVRLVGAARQTVEAVALGEAAIALTLQNMAARAALPTKWLTVDAAYEGRNMVVEIVPMNGLIDINKASPALLASLYAVAGAIDAKPATALAEATVQVRSERDARGREQGFEAVQDLLRVPGVDYDLYARLSRLITAEAQGSGKINPQAAPVEVLAVLAQGNTALASALAVKRSSGAADIDTTALSGEFIDTTTSLRYKLLAYVALPDGARVVVSRSVDLRPDPRVGLPWRIFNAEHWMQGAPAKGV